MIWAYIKRVKRNGLISANSSLYCELDEKIIPAIKDAITKNSAAATEIADMSTKSSMWAAIKTYWMHRIVLFLLGGRSKPKLLPVKKVRGKTRK